MIVDPADLELDAASEAALEQDRERARRNVEILREYAARVPEGKQRRIVLRFLVSPLAILGDGKVEAIEVVRNELVEENGRIVARPTGETRDDPLRARAAQRRLSRRAAPRRAVRRARGT